MTWIFALDHTRYSRWLSIHIPDMMTLADKHPDVLAEFQSGNFVVHKTSNRFLAMVIDQCHEQNNKMVKGSGRAIRLTGNPGALRRWMVEGLEIARITAEFEEQAGPHGQKQDTGDCHHDQKPGVQTAFLMDFRSLVAVMKEMGNPFLEDNQDLLVLGTRAIMDRAVAEIVRNIESFQSPRTNGHY